ncbi:hypothetical protein CAEBREN_07649 [Caenorhabditis brenneri]|uniref:Uncharacterized protein n=1 Tax=Caenorhabditis brenneri TaxID=135651 RepID=G0NY07_CAEBE|nr:hypothetical protein CAEBREN_07649 [Caenorhabditis brenneri]
MNVLENKEINQETQFSNSDDSGVECLCVSEMTIPNSYTSHEEQSIIAEPSSSFIMETQAVDERQQKIPSYGTAGLTEEMLEDKDNDLNDTTKTQPLSNKEEKQIDFALYKDPLRPQLIPATDTFWFQECKSRSNKLPWMYFCMEALGIMQIIFIQNLRTSMFICRL